MVPQLGVLVQSYVAASTEPRCIALGFGQRNMPQLSTEFPTVVAHLRDLDQLISVVGAVEERLLAEHHTGQGAT